MIIGFTSKKIGQNIGFSGQNVSVKDLKKDFSLLMTLNAMSY